MYFYTTCITKPIYRFSPENPDLMTTLGLLYLQVTSKICCLLYQILFSTAHQMCQIFNSVCFFFHSLVRPQRPLSILEMHLHMILVMLRWELVILLSGFTISIIFLNVQLSKCKNVLHLATTVMLMAVRNFTWSVRSLWHVWYATFQEQNWKINTQAARSEIQVYLAQKTFICTGCAF